VIFDGCFFLFLCLNRIFTGNGKLNSVNSKQSEQQLTEMNIFWSFLMVLMENLSDLKLIMNVFCYFLARILFHFRRKYFSLLFQSSSLQHTATSLTEIATQTNDDNTSYYLPPSLQGSLNPSSAIHPKLLQLMISFAKNLSPVVIIISPPPNNSQFIRMSCPQLKSIEKFGGNLFSLIQVKQQIQLVAPATFFLPFFLFFLIETTRDPDRTMFYFLSRIFR
jgi:hypothetical protein